MSTAATGSTLYHKSVQLSWGAALSYYYFLRILGRLEILKKWYHIKFNIKHQTIPLKIH